MKKIIIALIAILATIATLLTGAYFFFLGNQASNPDQIAKKLGLKLPAYQIAKSDDNLDRTASVWTDYYFEIEFEEPLADRFLRKVTKHKHCIKKGNSYRIEKENPDEWAGFIEIYPETNSATLEYTFRNYLTLTTTSSTP